MTRNDPIKHFFIWPALIIVLMISIFPLVYSMTTSFMSMRLVPPTPARFVGFGNYIDLLQNPRFWHVAGTTTLIAFISVGLQYVIGLSVALALNSKVPGEGIFRVSFLLPMLVAPVAVALIARQVLNPTMGPLNELMTAIGFPNLPFLTQTSWALGSIIAVEVWQWTPFVILMLLAGLQTLPDDVYEAAALENATPWQQFRDITFPMLLPISVAVVFIRLIESYKIIDTVFVMTGGGPGISTETLTLFAYQEGFKKFNLGYTSALSFLFLIVITVIGLVYLAILKPYLEKHK
ncbi:multiple sugar transport system permease protein [Ensifer sp. KUDG1]|uniref:carbohydrate ABC transporter permease n=1 Tax=Ensifer sp. KUDG1 TaxID=3373919 RepID=UPI003D1A4BB0